MPTNKFILNDAIKVRKESFGCIVLIKEKRAVQFFNEFGYRIFLTLKKSSTVEEIYDGIAVHYNISEVPQREVWAFVQKMVAAGICRESSNDELSKADYYFTEMDKLTDDYFYAPLGVEIEYTNKCARQCDYCSYYSNPFVDINTEMKLEQWKAALDDIVASGVYFVRFTGGDPFMRSDILEAVQYADDLGLIVSMGSDLTVTKESDFEALAKLKNFVHLQTTLDGATMESCERFRGKGNFQKVLKGMELMKKHQVPFIVGTVLTKYNVNEIEQIGRLVSTYDAQGYCFSPLYIAGRGIGIADSLPSNEDLYHANMQLKKLVDEGIVQPADSAWSEITKDLEEKEFRQMLDNQSYLTRSGERLVRIDPKGHVYVSVKLKRVLVENDEEWHGGNIKNEKLLKIWHSSEDLQKWRNLPKTDSPVFGKAIDTREYVKAP